MKKALCCLAPADAPKDGVHPLYAAVFLGDLSLQERPACETDEAHWQLIPYIVVQDTEGAIYTYMRGNGGDEDRLHAKLSIGLGGHIDREPENGEPLISLFRSEAARELREEIGVDVTPEAIHFNAYIVDRTDEVGRVHVGILGYVTVTDEQKTAMLAEAGVIEKGHFATLDALRNEYRQRLENWSRHVVDHLPS